MISSSEYLYSPKLNLALSRIKDNLIINESKEEGNRKYKVKQPHLSSTVDLTDPDKLFGLTERAAAMESLIFLGQQYENFKNYFEYLTINSPQRSYLQVTTLFFLISSFIYMFIKS